MQGLSYGKLDRITKLIDRISYKPETYHTEYRNIDAIIPDITNFPTLISYFTEYTRSPQNYKLHEIYSSCSKFYTDYSKLIELKERVWRVILYFITWLELAGWRSSGSVDPKSTPSTREISDIKNTYLIRVRRLQEYAASINYVYPGLSVLAECNPNRIINTPELINAFIEITGGIESNTNYLFYKLVKPLKHLEIVKRRLEERRETPHDLDYALETRELVIFPELFKSSRSNRTKDKSEKKTSEETNEETSEETGEVLVGEKTNKEVCKVTIEYRSIDVLQ